MGEPDIVETPEPTPSEPGSAIDPNIAAELSRLQGIEAEYNQYKPFLDKTNELGLVDDVRRFVDNETDREVARNAWQGFSAIQKEREKASGADQAEREKKVDAIYSYIEGQKQTQEQQATERAEFDRIGKEIAKIGSEYPALAANGYKFLQDKIAEIKANPSKFPHIRTYDQLVTHIAAVAPYLKAEATPASKVDRREAARKTPPTSLRGDASMPGLATTPQKVELNRKGMKNYLKQTLSGIGRA